MQNIQNSSSHPQRPLVSFILTYYNLPVDMLCACIRSILNLSLRPDEREILLIDDGSDQSPLEQLKQFDNDVIYVRQPNSGLSMARNKGIQMATGTYLQFVDADDLLVRAPYEHCLDLARQNKADMIMFDFTPSPAALVPFVCQEPSCGIDYMRRHNIRGTACGYLFKQTTLGELRFTPGIYHEDEEFTPQLLLRAENVCVTNAKAYVYRKRPGSIITSTNVRQRLKRLNDLHGVILKLNTLADTLPTADRTALQRRVHQLTMDYIYKIIVETERWHYLERKLNVLRRNGLYPLPDKDYTAKYTWFRRVSSTSAGLRLLLRVLPLMKRER